MQPAIVGIGEVLWDLLPDGKLLGGAPANFVYQCGALGSKATLVTSVGTDDYGAEIRRRIGSWGLGLEYVNADPEHPTGSVLVNIDSLGKPSYTISPDVAWDFLPHTGALRQLAQRAEAVCFGTLAQRSEVSRATIQAFLTETSSTTLRLLDINLRQSFYSPQIIEQSLHLANALKINDDELVTVAALLRLQGDEISMLQRIEQRYQLRLIALTKGARGSLLLAGGRVSRHDGFRVEVVDTIGAGDAFTAALVTGFLRGQDLDAIHERASRVAAFVCTQRGATPTMPPII